MYPPIYIAVQCLQKLYFASLIDSLNFSRLAIFLPSVRASISEFSSLSLSLFLSLCSLQWGVV